MHEIKFKGKRLDNGEWVYGSFVFIGPNNPIYKGQSFYQIIDTKGNVYDVDPKTVGQFTGLHDKNVKEIYEGDIVETALGNMEIKWRTFGWFGSFKGRQPQRIDGCNIKSIGNIHENPELLEVG